MSTRTNIQWADTTVNPIMGCGGCELFPHPQSILKSIDDEMMKQTTLWRPGEAYDVLLELVAGSPAGGHQVTTTNIYHARHALCEYVDTWSCDVGVSVNSAPLKDIIEKAVTCYAAKLHLNKATSIGNPFRKVNPGYAPTFESITQFPGRMAKVAKLADLKGRGPDLESPWKAGLPRMIFTSDMGDAFSREGDFGYLKDDAMPAITSAEGRHHLWLWLTKRPLAMAKFSKEIGGLPANVCAMTTLTCAESANLRRVDQLRGVDAHCRGLSIEPLRERIPASKLDLHGIDWVIVGGESGKQSIVHPFQLEWALELKEYCQAHEVAFFMKQYGRSPFFNGKPVKLKHSHGGNWDEWPNSPDLRLRQFPKYFHQYQG